MPAQVFGTPYVPPKTDGYGWPRENIVKAASLLEAAGYEVRDFTLVNKQTGEPLKFEFLYSSPTMERILLPYISNLSRLGIQVSARIVDQSQYVTRLRSFEFDMIWSGWEQSESPGNEQRDFFSSAAAANPASRNYAGISNPIVDQLIELIIKAPTRESLVARTRALDRVLQVNRFVVPNWHLPAVRVVYWDKFGKPAVLTKNGPLINAWWHDEARASALESSIRDDEVLTDTARNNISGDDAAGTGKPLIDLNGHSSSILYILLLLAGVIVALAWLAHASLTRQVTDVDRPEP